MVSAITEWTRSGGPGDVVVLAGEGLDGIASVTVTATRDDGSVYSGVATVESSSNSGAILRLPADAPANAVLSMSVADGTGQHSDLLVNAPELWWIGPDEVKPGAATSLFGRNLVLGTGDHPIVTFEMTSGPNAGHIYTATVTAADGYRVDVVVPASLPVGTYVVHYANSDAGHVTESASVGIDLSVRSDIGLNWTGSDHAVIKASDYGAIANDGKDDSAAIAKAMAAASALMHSNPAIKEVTVQLGAGTFNVSSSVGVDDGVSLAGMGAGATTLKALPVAGVSPASVIYARYSNTLETAVGARVTALAVDTDGTTAIGINATNSHHFTIDGVAVVARGHSPVFANNAEYLTLAHSSITGIDTFIGASRQTTIVGNDFYGTNQADANIHGFGSSETIIVGNTAQNLAANPTAENALTDTYTGRFIVEQPHFGQAVNQYIAANQTHDIGPVTQFGTVGIESNVGEQIMYESVGEVERFDLGNGLFKSATATSLTIDLQDDEAAGIGTTGLLTVVGGAGAGATTQIIGYNAQTGTYTFADPLNVPLDATSVFTVSWAGNHVAIVGNSFDGSAANAAIGASNASTGVSLYPAGARTVIDGNQFSDLSEGVRVGAYAYEEQRVVGPSFLDIKNNGFDNVEQGIRFDSNTYRNFNINGTTAQFDPHAMFGTTVRHNDMSGVTGSSFGFTSEGTGAADISAWNVADSNILSVNAKLLVGLGFDGGDPNFVVFNDEGSIVDLFDTVAHGVDYFAARSIWKTGTTQTAFVATFDDSGKLEFHLSWPVLGKLGDGRAAYIATGTDGNDIGVASEDYPWESLKPQVLDGGKGIDILISSKAGEVYLMGGEGNDFLIAGNGAFSRTTMTGGAGADNFVLSAASAVGHNTISDFSSAEGDRVLLDFDYAVGSDPIGGGLFRVVNTSLGTSVQFDTTGNGTFVQLAFAVGATLSTADLFWPAIASIEDAVGLVIENKTNTVTGALADAVAVGGDGAITIRGRYGVVEIDASGHWSYALDCANATVSALGSRSPALTDTIRVTLANGQKQDIVVSIQGTDADKTLAAASAGQTLTGGDGNDTYQLDSFGSIQIIDTAGVDVVTSSVTRSLAGYGNIEHLTLLGSGKINATGNDLDNILTGNSAANVLTGGKGNDTLIGGGGSDTLDGGEGNDLLIAESGTVKLVGGAGNDTYQLGGNSAATITDSSGIDTITSTVTRSLAKFTTVENLALLGTGNTNGTGNALANTITGNSGNNVLDGGAGTDTLAGGLGNDTYALANGNDTVIDTGGIDTITSTITRSLAGYADIENLTLLGSSAIAGTGNGLSNVITGNAAANTLSGNAGNDVLSGGNGKDTLIGGLGADILTGGAGNDTFRFLALEEMGMDAARDTITDFKSGLDKIDLSALDTLLGGPTASLSFIGQGGFSGHAGEVHYVAGSGVTIVEGDMNGDGVADFQIAVTGSFAFTAGNFLL
ncbi:MAG: VCBS domain-containing protein [Devosia sp.]